MFDFLESFSLSLKFPGINHVATLVFLVLSFFVIKVGRTFLTRKQFKQLPGPPSSGWMGYLPDLHDEQSLEYHQSMCNKYGHVARLRGGFFGLQSDAIYITDPLALHSILVKDQYNFPESVEFSGLFGIIHHGDNLASVAGPTHKRQRKLLNPIFTAAHISKLTPLFYHVAHQLKFALTAELAGAKTKTIDVLDLLTRTALELISQGGIGHTFDSFNKSSQEFIEFHAALKTVLPMAGRLFILLPYMENWRNMRPVKLRRLLACMAYYLPWPSLREFKWGVDTMHPVCKKVFEEKKVLFDKDGLQGLKDTPSGGKDLVSLLMDVNSRVDEEDRMPDEVVVANISSIVLGGQETTSGALTRLLCLLANDIPLQELIRGELLDAKNANGSADLDYNALNNLPLLDGVCREALRLFAPVMMVWRQTLQDCKVPLQFPIRNEITGEYMNELVIMSGTPVYLGLGAANRSKAIWGSDAEQLKPERWIGKTMLESTENGVKMPGIFSNIMTFLGGGRACPGMKFALLEIKLVMAVLMSVFSFEMVAEDIEWRIGITVSPYVKRRIKDGPSAPMKVKIL